MSRSGYSEDVDDYWALIRYRGAVLSSIRGKRGQAFLCELLAALDAMPDKALISETLEEGEGVCALGAVCRSRGIDTGTIDPGESDEQAGQLAKLLGIAPALAREIVYVNDEDGPGEDERPSRRWARMRAWVDGLLTKGAP